MSSNMVVAVVVATTVKVKAAAVEETTSMSSSSKHQESKMTEIRKLKVRRDQVTSDVVLGELEKVMQSNQNFATDNITIKVHHIVEQREQARQLCLDADVEIGIPCGREELIKFETFLEGYKITVFSGGRIKFIDSISFFQMKLADLPKAFGLPDSFKKGYFPHGFNTMENQNYVGEIPPKETFFADSMSVKEREIFDQWYAKQVNDNIAFDFKKEFLEYCVSDVSILRQACLVFRKLFQEIVKVDPFTESITIAGGCNLAFRRNFLPDDTVGLIPKSGYRRVDTQSKVALMWLVWLEHTEGHQIEHAGRGREKVLPEGMRENGYAEINNEKVVYEFHGCFFHGCKACYGNETYTSFGKNPEAKSAAMLRHSTESKMAKLKQCGYKVIQMWQCDFLKKLENNPEMKEYVSNHPMVPEQKLDIRDSFFGGRTNAMELYAKCEPDEKIIYLDFCSLYPFINKYKEYPIGHPEVFVGDECPPLEDIYGFVCCQVLPPKNLYHPVLPARFHNKLMFVLCKRCTLEMNQSDCRHEDKDRVLEGTWVSEELKEAVACGYKIVKMIEVWKYKTMKYDPTTGSEGLFSGYINTFLKLKVEASGWPSTVDQTDMASKQKYIEEFFKRENVQLDINKIEKNPGLRSVSKICLNCLWGFFGMRENKAKTTFVSDARSLFEIVSNAGVKIVNLVLISDTKMLVVSKMTDEAYIPNKKTNVAIASVTTAAARLHLYSFMKRLGNRVIYVDTDSLIIKVKATDDFVPETGVFLGDLTDELEEYGKGEDVPARVVRQQEADKNSRGERQSRARSRKENFLSEQKSLGYTS
ncbi:hypothetical protein B566_EDAN016822 [Ephemera danica]|nr:hypothetical protein B566_EDAN016822 [Ephemera danica]